MIRVALIDYGLANLRSVQNALSCFECEIKLAEHGSDLMNADRILLPGVGAFDAGMQGLRDRGFVDALTRRVKHEGIPFLGICLGLQFLFESSEEGSLPGLGWFPGRIRRFSSQSLKVPHMGWSAVEARPGARLFSGMASPIDFYFVHSFFAPCTHEDDWVAGTCHYGQTFAAAVELDNISAVQFHPEKSQLGGMKLLESFLMQRP